MKKTSRTHANARAEKAGTQHVLSILQGFEHE
jgi:hypothetical protein